MTERVSFLINDADVPALRQIVSNLIRIGYSETAVRQRLGLHDLADLQWRAVPIYRAERLAARDPLALVIDLFLLQGVLSAGELDRLFVASDQFVLVHGGLLEIDEVGSARARASLFPVGDRLIFSDHAWPKLPHPGYTAVPYDQVMFVGADSRALARCTVRQPVRIALDLCTGSGIQALLASRHSQRVLAVDINSRAAGCARLNARISGAHNVEVMVGDLFEAMGDVRFDLITANPPFVPSPFNTLRFRDGGRSGEDIQKRVVAGLPRHLAPGGIAQIITELGERDAQPVANRLREWIDGAPMDIYIIRLHEYSAAKYAIGHAQGDDYQTFLDAVQQWGSNLHAQGYVRVVVTLISFQWSDPSCGPPWTRVEEAVSPQRAAGAEIESQFHAERLARRADLPEILRRSWLRRTGPIALLDAQLLGGEKRVNTKATLMGQALTIERHLDPVEREILNHLEKRIAVAELLLIFRQLSVEEATVLAGITSLLRQRLACIDAQNSPQTP